MIEIKLRCRAFFFYAMLLTATYSVFALCCEEHFAKSIGSQYWLYYKLHINLFLKPEMARPDPSTIKSEATVKSRPRTCH